MIYQPPSSNYISISVLPLPAHYLSPSMPQVSMGPRSRRKNLAWSVPPLSPLVEGPDPEAQQGKKWSSWEVIRTWVRMHMEKGFPGSHFPISFHGNGTSKRRDLKLTLGVLGCPLAPITLVSEPTHPFSIRDTPIEASSAQYIIHQYLAATGCSKLEQNMKSLYAMGIVKMVCCQMDNAFKRNAKMVRANGSRAENGCFVLWQLSPGMWQVELLVSGYKVVAGSDGWIVWRHVPWLGTHAARAPQRPLRRIVQGLDPRSTASMFRGAQCLGDKRIGDDDCFVLKVSADRAAISERNEGSAEVIRHVLYGYFSQRSGLLVYLEDSHLTRVQCSGSNAIYWETNIGSSIEDYRMVDGVLIAHQGRSVATMFCLGETSTHHRRMRMEEAWRIDDIVFNVPGLSVDCFITPTEILSVTNA